VCLKVGTVRRRGMAARRAQGSGLNSVTLTVPSRLHLGFLDISGTLGRRFGSIGLALDRPVTSLTLRAGGERRVQGSEAERAARYLATMCRHLGIPDTHELVIHQAIPAHAGLGSGTQLALAVAAAVRALHVFPLDPRDDALLLDRGARSGIGIGIFEQGGLVVDGGRGEANRVPQIVSRLKFPSRWRVLLVLDDHRQGIHGDAELQAFRDLPSFPEDRAAHLCHLVLMRILPALAEEDLAAFGAGIGELQSELGRHFEPAQDGLFTSPAVGDAVRFLVARGGVGPGQSSWGPTGFVFADGADAAAEIGAAFRRESRFHALRLLVAAANNRGATVETGSLQELD
jgi:beta-ribofuranosylaminobenzene 5'-phosphate synthase